MSPAGDYGGQTGTPIGTPGRMVMPIGGRPPRPVSVPAINPSAEPGRSTNLPAELLGRWGATEKFNTRVVQGNTNAELGWAAFDVDRPTILFPRHQLIGLVHYRPHDAGRADFSGDHLRMSVHASGPGVCFLHAPGKWWVHYQSNSAAEFLMVPAEDPNFAAQLLAEPGFQVVTHGSLITDAVANTAEVLVNANPRRRMLSIYCTQSGQVAIVFGFSATPSATPGTQVGHIIAGAGSNLQLAGPSLSKDAVRIAGQNPSMSVTYVECS